MSYDHLSREDFDAIVTGELAHFAIWLEGEVIELIAEHFVTKDKRADFKRLLLFRDGLTFQDKIEIARAMLPLFMNQGEAATLKDLLVKVESFKATRNAFAHGVDTTPKNSPRLQLHIEVVNRAGKEKTVIVTPETHSKMISEAESLLKALQACRRAINVQQ